MMNITATTLEDYLVSEGVIIYKVVGKSMEPMIRQNRDLVTIIKREPDVKCSENDVVLFKKKTDI
jgi:signal peptidase I